MTEYGNKNLTAAAPKEIDDIEKFNEKLRRILKKCDLVQVFCPVKLLIYCQIKKTNQISKESIMYKHVLVAVDLSDESEFLLKKAVGIAKRNDAQLSIIHVDVNFSDLYTGLIDVNMSSMQDRISSETQKALINLAEHAGYPIKRKIER